jgi:hypothetical protein
VRHAILLGIPFLAAGLCVVGCTDDPPAVAASAPELNALSITFDSATEVNDAPRLVPGADGALTCDAERFRFEGRERITCKRGPEQLEVILRGSEALLVHKPKRTGDNETFFACSKTGDGPAGLPKSLDCKVAPLRDRADHGGGLSSPFDSTVPGITIPNAHVVGKSPKLLRSMAPGTPEEFDQLFAADVAAVLVFKNATTAGHDVDEEVATLRERGLAATRIAHVPFKWKDIGPFQEPCEQTIEALRFLKKNLAAGRTTLFHCTVGEDRTGFLAAMHRLVTEKTNAVEAWNGEMCEHGYGAGNPLKPGFVLGKLEDSLGPLYRKMAYLAAKGELDALDASICATDPAEEPDFEEIAPPQLSCGTSTLFIP